MSDRLAHFREIEHTADIAVEAWGRSFASLLGHAAEALFTIQGLPRISGSQVERVVRLTSVDREALLVDWLNELLYLSESNGEVYTSFLVHEASDTTLSATVQGYPGRVTGPKIKAATFHDLEIHEEGDRWRATIVFDV